MAAYQRLSAAAAGATGASYAAMAMDLMGRRAISPMGYTPKAIRGRGSCDMTAGRGGMIARTVVMGRLLWLKE